MKKRGKFIAFCGLDGSGKTTIINSGLPKFGGISSTLKHPPESLKVALKSEPKLSPKQELSYITYLKCKEQSTSIIPELLKGNDVITDRYIFCSYAHFMKKDLLSPLKLYEITKDIIMPDLIIYLKISPKEALSRIDSRSVNTNFFSGPDLNLPIVQKSADAYDFLAKVFDFKVVQNDYKSVEDSVKECYKHINDLEVDENIKTIGEFLKEKELEKNFMSIQKIYAAV